jgi:hypothetical protein
MTHDAQCLATVCNGKEVAAPLPLMRFLQKSALHVNSDAEILGIIDRGRAQETGRGPCDQPRACTADLATREIDKTLRR